ncbi:tyrosine-type recombinase/integrase [Corynebacterium timonense]|uniref:Site-specific recombinase XerC n=1 Tax=Corynebacterium timonense TaxID=441500 RepID=A0A1H1LTM3_9CORY|nr:site-specific integrase [Corynebacterium timonense]SDR77767.1 Site-specific recombinase XerC [Corynebacterium timonense]
MSATVGNIYRKKSTGLWAFTIDLGVTPDGKRHRREITAKRKDKLVEKRRKAMKDVLDGTYITGTSPTVAAWWTHWCDTIAAPRVRPNVLANYRSYGRVHVIPAIGRQKLDALTVDHVRFLHSTMRDGGASSRTVQAVHNTLHRVLTDALREGKVPFNVCDRMDKPRASSREREALSAAEVRALVNVIEAEPPMWRARWLMALRLGARQGECLGMEWERVDLSPGQESADVSWQLQRVPWRHGAGCPCREGVSPARCPQREPAAPEGFEIRPCYKGLWFQRPKTAASIRRAPMTPDLAAALRVWREESGAEGLVFRVNGKPILARDDTAAWRELCVRAGVRPVDLHSARHTMVTGLLEAGVDPEIIRQIVGHSTLVSTRHYLHVSQDAARAALTAWG